MENKEHERYLITSALPYVNNVPHLGNIIGCVLSADVFARYCRLKGRETYYVCGTDEYGTATETKAIQEGLTPKEVCDKYHAIHKCVYEKFNISFDVFGRTSTNRQTEITHQIFKDLWDNGYIIEKEIEQFYCSTPTCNRFLADRYVKGKCAKCGHLNKSADQCDKCNILLETKDLINPTCFLCNQKVGTKKSDHLFLDLAKIQPDLKKWIEKSWQNWTSNAVNNTKGWINEPLKERCITRDLEWGTPVPYFMDKKLEKYKGKVFYVWFDAPIGYISISSFKNDEVLKYWWQNPNKVKHYEFMAKDNVPFHSIIFPATLLATQKKWTLPYNICSVDYLNFEGQKFSKSNNVGIFGDQIDKFEIDIDVWRLYLLFNRPELHDRSFKEIDFVRFNNSELINNLGNFVNRILSLCYKNREDFQKMKTFVCSDEIILRKINQIVIEYDMLMDSISLKNSLRKILELSDLGNKYLQHNKPWVLIKENKKEEGLQILYTNLHILHIICRLLLPFAPSKSKEILSYTGLDIEKLDTDKLNLIKPKPVFKKLEYLEQHMSIQAIDK